MRFRSTLNRTARGGGGDFVVVFGVVTLSSWSRTLLLLLLLVVVVTVVMLSSTLVGDWDDLQNLECVFRNDNMLHVTSISSVKS